jgi:hypothetical protein
MTDFQDGIKKDVAEIKFLIHDLRVEKFINDVIHYQVTLNTDLEIHNIEQVAVMHGHDLYELKKKAQELRNAFRSYSNAVKSFSPPQTILATGAHYIETIQDVCELIVNPLWGRFDSVITFLPGDCRSVQSVRHYKNCLHWVCGVYYRIEHFLDEKGGGNPNREFDIGDDVENFTVNVIQGYVREKSSSRVDITFNQLDSAVISGNHYRFRRMLFNLVMNSVDAMSDQQVGTLRIGVVRNGDRAELSVEDDGRGMDEEKVKALLSDRDTLDGDLHSLGFVFVRQTVAAFDGELKIQSTPGSGTMMKVSLPYLKSKAVPRRSPSKCEKFRVPVEALPGVQGGGTLREEVRAPFVVPQERSASARVEESVREAAPVAPAANSSDPAQHGQVLLGDYDASRANFRGCIFAISVDDSGEVDLFYHRPYEEHWDISHEDLAPMLYDATVRGRIEEDDRKNPGLILKAPLNLREYLALKGIDEREFSAQKYNDMVRDEYINISRVLIRTGLPAEMTVQATDLQKVFADYDNCFEGEPFAVQVLADQKRSGEL